MKNILFTFYLFLITTAVMAQDQKGMVSICSMSIESDAGSSFVCIGEPIIGSFQQQSFLGIGFDYLIFDLESINIEETLKSFTSLPNPFDNIINVEIEDDNRDRFLIRVISSNGRLIDEREQPSQFTYDLGFLSAGIYGLLVHDIETKMLLGKRKIVKR